MGEVAGERPVDADEASVAPLTEFHVERSSVERAWHETFRTARLEVKVIDHEKAPGAIAGGFGL